MTENENTVVMDDNLELCLQRIFGDRRTPTAGQAPAALQRKASMSELAREAMKLFEKARDLQRQGDWAGYGEALKKLEQALKQMATQ